VVSATDPHGRILGFLDLSNYHFGIYTKIHNISNGLKVRERSQYTEWLGAAGQQRGQSSSPTRVKNFLFFTSAGPALGPSQLPILVQWVTEVLSRG
jgi:hypothetical protein